MSQFHTYACIHFFCVRFIYLALSQHLLPTFLVSLIGQCMAAWQILLHLLCSCIANHIAQSTPSTRCFCLLPGLLPHCYTLQLFILGHLTSLLKFNCVSGLFLTNLFGVKYTWGMYSLFFSPLIKLLTPFAHSVHWCAHEHVNQPNRGLHTQASICKR